MAIKFLVNDEVGSGHFPFSAMDAWHSVAGSASSRTQFFSSTEKRKKCILGSRKTFVEVLKSWRKSRSWWIVGKS